MEIWPGDITCMCVEEVDKPKYVYANMPKGYIGNGQWKMLHVKNTPPLYILIFLIHGMFFLDTHGVQITLIIAQNVDAEIRQRNVQHKTQCSRC